MRFAVLLLTGMLAARHGATPKSQVLAGLIAGALIDALTVGTFVVVDNVWRGIVSQPRSAGSADSPAANARHCRIGGESFV
ncbi:MAG TPA: hypothetical protein VK659_30285 [Asanoa sp.]|nr:hypothetical protein [Asanoa sp.]